MAIISHGSVQTRGRFEFSFSIPRTTLLLTRLETDASHRPALGQLLLTCTISYGEMLTCTISLQGSAHPSCTSQSYSTLQQ